MIAGQLGKVIARAVQNIDDDDEVVAVVEALVEMYISVQVCKEIKNEVA